MAKNALGKGLGALLGENPAAQEEVAVSTGAVTNGGLHNTTLKRTKLPAAIKMEEDGSMWLDPALLKPNPKQPRIEFNQKQLDELCESIKSNGILQPIIVEDAGDGSFYIIAGERRTRAARMAGLTKVPVQLRKFDEQQKLEMALIENIQRADLNPIEEATAYYNLIQMGDLNQEEVAKRVGKARATVANAIRLLKLPEDIQHALVNGQITSGHARALLMVKNDADMRVMFAKIVGNGLSVREAEALADTYNGGGRAAAKKDDDKKVQKKDPDVLAFEQELRNIFGTRDVSLKGDINKGFIIIGFDNKKDFDRIYEVLMSKKA
ncbi:chromosome segregation DNA-binding protein [Treponema bryantii]|uniref:Chromosome segregation DNA-binding protein n=1 Tax=Treponema bryantii TaxID=163 RepID=A0A1H9C618_9SPIR|nr:ParB/RepB/Spo0J family partition protein [Treponema bryantii]SEP96427.1 chromosome segregation DNA-binding protein [Treponema bryantii]